jgi:hypothetical protein
VNDAAVGSASKEKALSVPEAARLRRSHGDDPD